MLVAHNVLNVPPPKIIVQNVNLIEFLEVNQNVIVMMDMLKSMEPVTNVITHVPLV
jgi:ABC-type lipoprotein export system ATPase subunit